MIKKFVVLGLLVGALSGCELLGMGGGGDEGQQPTENGGGGMDMRDERRALERGAHIVVATPGRLRDHIMRGSIDLSQIRAVVLDEADEMLDLGFTEDLEMILDETPVTRRTLLFSATVPKGIAQLAKKYQRDAIRITTLAEKSQHTDIEYRAIKVGKHDGENAIINVLRYHEAPSAIVFANADSDHPKTSAFGDPPLSTRHQTCSPVRT